MDAGRTFTTLVVAESDRTLVMLIIILTSMLFEIVEQFFIYDKELAFIEL